MTIREGWDALLSTPLGVVLDAAVLVGVGFLAVCAIIFTAFLLWSMD